MCIIMAMETPSPPPPTLTDSIRRIARAQVFAEQRSNLCETARRYAFGCATADELELAAMGYASILAVVS